MDKTEQEERFNHAVLGLTGKEQVQKSKFKTFCNLCRTRIPRDSEVLVLVAQDQQEFYIHVDCGLASMTQLHHLTFLEDVKMRPTPKRTNRPEKKVRQGDGSRRCLFCWRVIEPDETYVKEGKKTYHGGAKQDCWTRYKQVEGRTKASLEVRSSSAPRKRKREVLRHLVPPTAEAAHDNGTQTPRREQDG